MPAHTTIFDLSVQDTTADTIAAIATAPGTGAIAIVRFSGNTALSILSELFRQTVNDHTSIIAPEDFEGHRAYHGFLLDADSSNQQSCHDAQCRPNNAIAINQQLNSSNIVDEIVVVTYRAPHSYTGEDLVEINCHGGPLVSTHILELVLKHGARLAQPGEFTQRAYLSGRLDLTQAEAVLDVIQAKTARQGKLAVSALTGHIGKQINDMRVSLVELLTRVTAGIDFPDEVGEVPVEEIAPTIESALSRLQILSQTALSGRFLREGLRLAIVGRPNAGKSSLLNQLLKFERAIVTDVPGTTRDSIEEQIDLNGIPVTLIDTAGIRATQDAVETIGIDRSRQAIEAADLVVLVVDLLEGWGEPESQIQELIGVRPFMLAYNKIDLAQSRTLAQSCVLEQDLSPEKVVLAYSPAVGTGSSAPELNEAPRVFLSAKTGQGIDELSAVIEKWALGNNSLPEQGSTLNERQAQLCLKAIDSLQAALQAVQSTLPQDCIASDLKMAIDHLSEISGQSVSEEVISQVFANFCIGK
jgi:tRNA modification GTPase